MEHKILVVEDERVVAMDIQNVLEKLGYLVPGIAATAEQAIAHCKTHCPHLVLMDIRLKGSTDGITAASMIKEQFGIPVIYLTAHADSKTLERAKVTQPFGYVLKPFDAIELKVAIELALYRSTPSDLPQQRKDVANNQSLKGLSAYAVKLQSLEAFSAVSIEALEKLLLTSTVKKVKTGELLAFEGDERDLGIITISGRVALFKSSLSGRELIVELLAPWELFGLAIALEEQPSSVSARAQVASEVLMVSKQSLISLLEAEHAVYRHFIKLISERLSRAYDLSRGLAHDKVDIRIATALLAAFPKEGHIKDALIHITRKELAEIAGTTVETAIRITKSMERNHLLDLRQNGCVRIPDIAQLQAFADSAL